MSVNDKETKILVIYHTKSKIIYKKEFGSFTKFGLVLDFFNSKIVSDSINTSLFESQKLSYNSASSNNNLKGSLQEAKSQCYAIRLKKKYLLNDIEIKRDDLLINLIKDYIKSQTIISATFSIELDEIFNIGDEDILPYEKILQPKFDDFGLYVFNPESGSLSLEEYPEKIIKFFKLKKINKLSSYCNSYDSLYISGGIYKEEEIKDFWIINNQSYKIEKKEIPFAKSGHSMKYIEYNDKQIILFIGGKDLSVFYYDIKNKNFESLPDLNSSYFRPSLIQVNNYLFCFNFSLDENGELFFQKLRLDDSDSSEHIWEKIYPNCANEEIKQKILNLNFFASKFAGNRIILIKEGNKKIKENDFLYDIKSNLLYINIISSNASIKLIDKNFYKINNNHNIILPDFSQENGVYEIGILNKIKYPFRKIKLNPCEQNKINFIKYKNIRDENTNIGKITVHFKTEESNQSESNINAISKNENYLDEYIFNIESNKLNSEKNIPTMNNSKPLINQKVEGNIENKEREKEEENIEKEENINMIKKDYEENDIKEEEKNEDYIIYDNSEIENEDKKFNDENNVENSLNGGINNLNVNNNNDENEVENSFKGKMNNLDDNNINNENMDENENDNNEEIEYYEEDENFIERDKFELTIKQPLGEDIIQIEYCQLTRYDPDNFCDYKPK